MTWMKSKGMNYEFTEYTPLSYKVQVVAGMNYTVIIRFSTTITFKFKIYQKLDGNVSISDSEEMPAGYTGLPKKEIKVKSAWNKTYKPITKTQFKLFTRSLWKVNI